MALPPAVSVDITKVEGQWAFVKTNWGHVSIIVIAAAAVGIVIGHFLL